MVVIFVPLEYDHQVNSGTLPDGFNVLRLLPGFPKKNRAMRGTRVREKSSRTASMASEKSVGMRTTEAKEVNCTEFQWRGRSGDHLERGPAERCAG